MKIRTKRVYDPPSPDDGTRVLVDRIWPRGVSKEKANVDEWAKEVAPSNELRKWFGHDPDKWKEFERRYFAELKKNPDVRKEVLPPGHKATVTLVFGARDTEHNNAVALKSYLEGRASSKRTGSRA